MKRTVVALALLASTTFCAARVGASTSMQWILNGPVLPTLTTDPVAVKYFSGKTVFMVGRDGASVPAPSSWNVRETRIFTSYVQLQKAFESGRVGPEVKAILYDNEHWKFTPEDEQRNFGEYAKRVAELVHAHGLLLFTAPADTLTRDYGTPAGEPRYEAYLRLKLAAQAAQYSDVFEIQSQGSEMNPKRFSSFVREASAQARAANPGVRVFAGISTSPNGQPVSEEQLAAAVDATREAVDGYWLNVPAQSEYCPNCAFAPEKALALIGRLAP